MSFLKTCYIALIPNKIRDIITRFKYSECRPWADYVKAFGLFRGTDIFARLNLNSGKCSILVPGAIGRIQVRVSTSDVGIFQEIFLDHLYLTPPGISPKFIIDGGANVGFTSIYFAMCFPEAQIIAIEPEYSNFEILSNNVKSYLNIRAINAALWSEKCCISLSNPDDLNCAFRVEPKASGEIETLTLDDLFKLAPDGQIDLLKVDIEGAERELFSKRDMRLNNVSCVMIELHERFAPGCEASFRTAFEGMDFIEHVQGDNIVLSKRKSA